VLRDVLAPTAAAAESLTRLLFPRLHAEQTSRLIICQRSWSMSWPGDELIVQRGYV